MDTLSGAKPKQTISSKRILVVDDEPFVCDAVKMMLTFDGHTVTTAICAKDALQLFEAGDFELVITDFAMPGMRGNEMAAIIKAQRPDMPIVMITAYAEMLDYSKESLGGVDCVVSKPFVLDDLRRAMVESMSRH